MIQYKNSLILQNIWFVQPYITMTNTHTKGLNRKNPSIFDHVTPLGPWCLAGGGFGCAWRHLHHHHCAECAARGRQFHHCWGCSGRQNWWWGLFLGLTILFLHNWCSLCVWKIERQGHRQLGWAITWVRPIWLIRGCITRRYYHNHLHQLVLWPHSVHLIKRTFQSLSWLRRK